MSLLARIGQKSALPIQRKGCVSGRTCTPKHPWRPSAVVNETDSAPVSAKRPFKVALLFDCDGVIVETEELHRMAYNSAFSDFKLTINEEPVVWTLDYYDVLQNTVGGGKPKMRHYFGQFGWPMSKLGPAPLTDEAKTALVDALQDNKTAHYKSIVENLAEARPGILKCMDEALDHPDVAVCICSASTKEGFLKVVESTVGPERLKRFDVILAGDDVTRKKPDPLIYNMTRERLGISADKCLVIEDSIVGVKAAIGAGMHCVVTPTPSTASSPFQEEGAAVVLPTLESATLNSLFGSVMGPDWVQLQPVKPQAA